MDSNTSDSTRPTIVDTISSAIWSCTSNTSSTNRSKLLDHRVSSLFIDNNWQLILILFPSFLTLPFIIYLTPSSLPISLKFLFLSLYAKLA